MGEFSKRIGDIGEEILVELLELIGWTNVRRNFDIQSVDPDKHEKKSHGIDGFFHYRSPMVSNTIESILISSKFSSSKYPNNPATTFKNYYNDLAIAIESFKMSDIRQDTINEHSNIEYVFDRGIIFWVNNHKDDKPDLYQLLYRSIISAEVSHDGIFLLDNRRVEFVYDTIKFVHANFPHAEIDFLYFLSGLNNDNTTPRNGKIMPIQYITASILPFRIQNPNQGETTVLLATIENFEERQLLKLMNLAKSLGNNLQVNTVICFPDYNRINHEQVFNNSKQILSDKSFTDRLRIVNPNDTLRT